MDSQSSSTKRDIKEAVRKRDDYRCVVCGMGNKTHKNRSGKILDVHRIEPPSDYDVEWGKCVTLCHVCHNALHEKGSWGWIAQPEDEEELASRVQQSAADDIKEESEWQRRKVWGTELRRFRENVVKVTPAALARSVEVRKKTLQDWEAGRGEPLLAEAKRPNKGTHLKSYESWIRMI